MELDLESKSVLVVWEHINIVWIEGRRAILCNSVVLRYGSLFPVDVFEEKFYRLKSDFCDWVLGRINYHEFCGMWMTGENYSIESKIEEVNEFLIL